MQWDEVTDVKQVVACWKKLRKHISSATVPAGDKKIGRPNGHFHLPIRLGQGKSDKEFWVYCGNGAKEGELTTLLGRPPKQNDWPSLIDVQFNYSSVKYARTKGGAFVSDESGQIFLAHRGIVTKGSRLKKSDIFGAVKGVRTIVADAGRIRSRLFLIAPLDDPELFTKICGFAIKVRTAARLIEERQKNQPESGSEATGEHVLHPSRGEEERNSADGRKSKHPMDAALRDYVAEFSGEYILPGRQAVSAQREHGLIVDALASWLAKDAAGDLKNPYNMDLVRVGKKIYELYEVKTSSNSQATFTAIGQLMFLGEALEQKYKVQVSRVMVLPETHGAKIRESLCNRLGIKLVTYSSSGRGVYEFKGL